MEEDEEDGYINNDDDMDEEEELELSDEPEKENPTNKWIGLGKPILGFRNWAAYPIEREGPSSRMVMYNREIGHVAKRDLQLIQRWRPHLMLDPESTTELLKEHYHQDSSTPSQDKADAMRLQGNTLWVPSAPTVVAPSDDGDEDGDVHSPPSNHRHLLVHAAGPILDQLHLSWVNEEAERGEQQQQQLHQRDRRKRGRCWMSGGAWSSGEVGGRIRQIAPLTPPSSHQQQQLPSSPLAFARGAMNATLFRLEQRDPSEKSTSRRRKKGASKEAAATAKEETEVFYYLCPLQKLQFKERLLDAAGRPHRAAFLTEDLRVYEWSSASGATDYNFVLADNIIDKVGDSVPRLAWGAHPRSLWLSAQGSLFQLDLRQKGPASCLRSSVQVSTGRWPDGLLGPDYSAYANANPNPPPFVGAIERHPMDENLLFASADAYLLALDLRQPRHPLSLIRQTDSSRMMTIKVDDAWSSQSQTWIASGCQTLPRLHLHAQHQAGAGQPSSPSDIGMIEKWCNETDWLSTLEDNRPLHYQTSTFVNWDATPNRAEPVWLSGLSVLRSPQNPSSTLLPYSTSLGDIYIQRIINSSSQQHRPTAKYSQQGLPCGISPHAKVIGGETTTPTANGQSSAAASSSSPPPPLPSSAMFQPYDETSLRDHVIVGVDVQKHFGPVNEKTNKPVDKEKEEEITAAGSNSRRRRREGGVAAGAASTMSKEERRETLKGAFSQVQEEMFVYMKEYPKTLIEVGEKLEALVPGSMMGNDPKYMRDFYHLLTHEKGVIKVQQKLLPSQTRRPEEARMVEPLEDEEGASEAEGAEWSEGGGQGGGKAAAAAVGGGGRKKGSSSLIAGGVCECDLTRSSSQKPCSSFDCGSHSLTLFYVSSEALVLKIDPASPSSNRKAKRSQKGGGEGIGNYDIQGLDIDTIQGLRGEWHSGD